MIESCPICSSQLGGTNTLDYLNTEFKTSDIFQTLRIRNCQMCGLSFAQPLVSKEKLDKFYAKQYRGRGSIYARNDYESGISDYAFDTKSVSQVLLAKTFKDFNHGSKYLDIGTGRGISLRVAKQLIRHLQPTAIEPDTHSHEVLKHFGIEIIPEVFGRDPLEYLEGKKFDLVLMSHVLEHYNSIDIHDVLVNVRNTLEAEGIFLCEVPNCDLKGWAETRSNDAPHLSFFSADSLRRAMTDAGFEVVYLNSVGERFEDEEAVRWFAKGSNGTALPILRRVMKAILPKRIESFIIKHRFSVLDVLADANFSYGVGRTCLRAIGRVS